MSEAEQEDFTCPFPFDGFDECVSEFEGDEDIDDPEAFCAAWEEECKPDNDSAEVDDQEETIMNTEGLKQKTQELIERQHERKTVNFAASSKDITVTKEEDDEGEKAVLYVPVQGLTEDRDGDIIVEEGQESLKEQVGQGNGVPAFPNHGVTTFDKPMYDFRDMMGAWTSAEMKDGVTFAKLELRQGDENAEELLDLIDQDMPVGFSIGFIPTEMEPMGEDEGDGMKIFDMDLLEISPVGIPSNPAAVNQLAKAGDRAAVMAKSAVAEKVKEEGFNPSEFAKQVEKAFEGDTMTDDENPEEEDQQDGSEPEQDGAEEENSREALSYSEAKQAVKEALDEYEEERLGLKAEGDVEAEDVLDAFAGMFEGVEASDLAEVMQELGAEFVGFDPQGWAALGGLRYDMSADEVLEAVAGDEEDDEEDSTDEDDDDEEMDESPSETSEEEQEVEEGEDGESETSSASPDEEDDVDPHGKTDKINTEVSSDGDGSDSKSDKQSDTDEHITGYKPRSQY